MINNLSWPGKSEADFQRLNSKKELPVRNSGGNLIVIGCNYHTKWQKIKTMRFVLAKVKDGKARLLTRNTNKDFWCDLDDLIMIDSHYNLQKAKRYRPDIFSGKENNLHSQLQSSEEGTN